jgi:hypothetical protein
MNAYIRCGTWKNISGFRVEQILNLLMIQHEAAAGDHNYYVVAANLIQAEYGVEE